MRIWRIASARYPALDGEGARLWGGRWNAPGTAAIYASSTVSLAALEKLVWADPDDLPDDLMLYEILLPSDTTIARIQAADLPAGWTEPGSLACMELEQQWLASGQELVLIVPSAVLPDAAEETNVLVNPRHAQAVRAQMLSATPFRFDLRLLR